jgi:hypothetical protein
MKERHLVRNLPFVDTTLGAGEVVEEFTPAQCPNAAIVACHSRCWTVSDKAYGVTGEPRIIRDQTGHWRVVSSDDLSG